MQTDYVCLRPEFTAQLIKQLQVDRCVNLIAKHGQGRRRTLADLQYMLAPDWQVLKVDMKHVQDDVLSILESLCLQAKIEKYDKFEYFIDFLSNNSNYILIIVHNFDLLHDLNVKKYLNDLYALKHISLLCVSEKQTDTGIPHINDSLLPVMVGSGLSLLHSR